MKTEAKTPEELMEWIAAGAKPKSESPVRVQRVVRRRTPKLWTSVLRQPDGSWVRDPMPTTLREAKKSAQFNRCLGGISTQIVEANAEETQNWMDEYGESSNESSSPTPRQ